MNRLAIVGCALLALLVSACEAPARSSTAPSASLSPTIARSVASPTATARPSPAAALLVVEKTGAALGPAGFMVFALVDNPSSQTASAVAVAVQAKDASGRLLGKNSGRIARIGAGQKQAIGLRVAVPSRAIPATFEAAVTGVTWLESGAAELVEVVDAAFAQDPKLPSVMVRLVNHAASPERATVTAVCFDDAGDIRGGGVRTVAIGAAAAGVDVQIAVTLPVTPATCEAFDTTS